MNSSLLRRVALGGAMAAGFGGAIAATTSGLTATELLGEYRRVEVKEAARHLADEVQEEMREEHTTLELALLDELDDVELVGARVRIDADAQTFGDSSLPPGRAGSCAEFELDGRSMRSCTVENAGLELTLAALKPSSEQSPLLGWSILMGFLVAAGLGGLLSFRFGRWALRPLETLTERVNRIDPDHPHAEALDPPLAHQETESLRLALHAQISRLDHALSRARHFASHAAHELRTPLSVVSGELELLAEVSPPSEELASARKQVHGLTNLVQRLLILADARVIEDGAEVVDLADTLEDVLRRLPDEHRARVQNELDEDVLVFGDGTLLSLMAANIIDNALKFSDGAVHVGLEARDGVAWLCVDDSGPGLTEEEQMGVLTPFYRTPSARATSGGYGIGLALIAHVVEAHAGTLSLDVPPTHPGLRVMISLPMKRGRTSSEPRA